ncbi:lipoprotein [Mesoplasma seiffertii]|uniref:lipoprotein n=1 Tax=Mesoplasma seiffertii TaxID=28224 RepID=UPI00047B7E71|nr:lipoprotein [Mesoplasma seiffertii]
MKKLLTILGAVTMTTTASSTIVSCGFLNNDLAEDLAKDPSEIIEGNEIKVESIKNQTEIGEIKELQSVEEVNKYLENITIVGIRSLSAKQLSDTDVLVTINVEPNYKLEGDSSFIIYNAIVSKDESTGPTFENKFVTLVSITTHPSYKKINRRKNTESINQLLSEIKVEGIKSIEVIERKVFDAQTAIYLEHGYQLLEGEPGVEPLLYIPNAYTENPIAVEGEQAVEQIYQAQNLLMSAINTPSSDWKTIKTYSIDAYAKIEEALYLGAAAIFPNHQLNGLNEILLILRPIKNGELDNSGMTMQAIAKKALERISEVLNELEKHYGEL